MGSAIFLLYSDFNKTNSATFIKLQLEPLKIPPITIPNRYRNYIRPQLRPNPHHHNDTTHLTTLQTRHSPQHTFFIIKNIRTTQHHCSPPPQFSFSLHAKLVCVYALARERNSALYQILCSARSRAHVSWGCWRRPGICSPGAAPHPWIWHNANARTPRVYTSRVQVWARARDRSRAEQSSPATAAAAVSDNISAGSARVVGTCVYVREREGRNLNLPIAFLMWFVGFGWLARNGASFRAGFMMN